MERAILGGGCFWCLEAVFQSMKGVSTVVSGYMGGQVASPSYEAVCRAETGHAEVVEIRFDPGQISYQELLDIFFEIHDPTTPNRQGNDVGSQYRSVIFATTADQQRTAAVMMEGFRASGPRPDWAGPSLVTELIDVSSATVQASVSGQFWPAEPVHQNYYRQHLNQGYCIFVVGPKVAKAEAKFKALIAQ